MSRSRKDGTEAASVDVVIVGAGFAGLSAAERLVSMGLPSEFSKVGTVSGADRSPVRSPASR